MNQRTSGGPDQPIRATEPAAGNAPEGRPQPIGQLLYTPAEAAVVLRVSESWLRKKAAKRLIPCTFMGRLLRFSPADLAAIATHGHRPVQPIGARRRNPPRRRSGST
ncbi:helix-turn-helix domain-containing protein [Catellatospora paridis]|uniref:helix-turn-helix domain-containing protein n=1 Tax=Catellatospora paridis TaxID=1617086 RepID=UPI0012D3F242|nr:helix-turn-helix domain-containing protein [Catellatospora paridis]